MKNYFIILGNGFTIDFLSALGTTYDIDVLNLFSQGDQVPYPTDREPGFLSFKHCPHLWELGARPFMNNHDAMNLIEDIITCANISHSATSRHFHSNYIQAYQELNSYLKSLFVYYNDKISDDAIKSSLSDWGWLKFFQQLNQSPNCENVTIVTYNYDIWLERLFINNNINFEILGLENGVYDTATNYKFKIIKPHGSINFTYGTPIDPNSFQISSTTRELTNGALKDYKVCYENLNNIYRFNALIPPAGDSLKLSPDSLDSEHNWASVLRALTVQEIKNLNYSDELIICGLSYWGVDRNEIDNMLTAAHADINVRVINPNPSSTFSAVINSLYKRSIFHKNSSVLGGIHR